MTPVMAQAPGSATNEATFNQQFVGGYNIPFPNRKPSTGTGQFQAFQDYLRSQTTPQEFVILDKIALCESGYRPDAQNSHSTAGGIFQFLDSTWSHWGEGNKYDGYANIRAGVKLYRHAGTDPWNASKGCWQ
jgi:hypothetical protein